MSKRRKTIKQAFQFAFSFWGGYRKKNMAGIVIVLVLCTNGLFASPIGYPASYTPAELLSHLFNGEYKADKKGGWVASNFIKDRHNLMRLDKLGDEIILYLNDNRVFTQNISTSGKPLHNFAGIGIVQGGEFEGVITDISFK